MKEYNVCEGTDVNGLGWKEKGLDVETLHKLVSNQLN